MQSVYTKGASEAYQRASETARHSPTQRTAGIPESHSLQGVRQGLEVRMSTDYYMACEVCQECYHVAQDGMSGFSFYSGEPRCMKGIGQFLAKHVLCGKPVLLLSEHRAEDYKIVDWPRW